MVTVILGYGWRTLNKLVTVSTNFLRIFFSTPGAMPNPLHSAVFSFLKRPLRKIFTHKARENNSSFLPFECVRRLAARPCVIFTPPNACISPCFRLDSHFSASAAALRVRPSALAKDSYNVRERLRKVRESRTFLSLSLSGSVLLRIEVFLSQHCFRVVHRRSLPHAARTSLPRLPHADVCLACG